MKLTPLDIKKQEFGKSFRGYDKMEVSAFLEIVSEEFEELLNLNNNLQEKIKELESSVANYEKLEEAWKNTLLTVEHAMEKVKKSALKESELILKEAEIQKEKILSEAQAEIFSLDKEIAQLKNLKQEFITKLKTFLESQSNLLENLSSDKRLEKIIGETEPRFEEEAPENIEPQEV